MRGLFVTGTDTGVGKTVLSAALLAAMAAAGEAVRAHKPVVTGLDPEPWTGGDPDPRTSGAPEPRTSGTPEAQTGGTPEPRTSGTPEAQTGGTPEAQTGGTPEAQTGGASEPWPPDHELLARAAGMEPDAVAPLRYGPAVSPHLAAELAGARIDPVRVVAAARDAASDADAIAVVEGVGGLLVPLAEDFTVRDLAVALGLPLLIAARPGLGTINHTLLTVQAARAAGLEVRAVVLTPWPAPPGALERSNRETIARLGELEVEGLPLVPAPSRDMLALAGAALPWRRWLADERFVSSEP